MEAARMVFDNYFGLRGHNLRKPARNIWARGTERRVCSEGMGGTQARFMPLGQVERENVFVLPLDVR